VREFDRRIVDRVAPHVPAVKPQLAFFEQLGAPGIAAYEDLVSHARNRGLLVVADAKRGDIGPTAEAYGHAFFGGHPLLGGAGPPIADALTVNPFFGSDGVQPFLEAADRSGSGLFLLVRTSNPSSAELQGELGAPGSLSEAVARSVDAWGRFRIGAEGFSSVGAVVGATHAAALRRFRELMPRALLLLPGYGAQGGTADDVVGAFDDRGDGAIVVAARSVLFAYRKPDGTERGDWEKAVEEAARAFAEDVRRALRGAGKRPPP
jgi:orotidine-5'-phosphate decarboxylase